MQQEINVQTFLDKIKEEGIEAAKKASREIVDRARSEADEIIREAEKEAANTVAGAEEEAKRIRETFENEMMLRARDLIIAIKHEIVTLFDRVLEREVASSLTPEFMKEMILKLLERWNVNENTPYEVLVQSDEAEKLEECIYHGLQDELRKGMVIRPYRNIGVGFRIGEKNGNVYYDLTDEAIAEILRESLNPRLGRFLGEIPKKI